MMETLRNIWINYGWSQPIYSSIVAALFGLALWWLFGLVIYLSRPQTTPPAEPSALKSGEPLPKKDIPPIYCKLQIDSVEDGQCKFHILLKNGPVFVENIEMHIWSENYTHYEPGNLARDIAPNDELGIPGNVLGIPVKLGNVDELTLTLYYDANVSNVHRHLIASYRFPFSKQDVVAQTITPSMTHYREGDRLPNRGREPSEKHLGRNVGTLVVGFQEEKGRIWTIRNGERKVTFDSLNRTVSLDTPVGPGAIVIAAPFKDTYDGYHICRVTWNPSGGSVLVDGGEVNRFP